MYSKFAKGFSTERIKKKRTLKEYEKVRVAFGLMKYDIPFKKAVYFLETNEVEVPHNFHTILPVNKEEFFRVLAKYILDRIDCA